MKINQTEHASKMAVWQGSMRRKVFLVDSKIAIFADNSKLYKIISKNTDKTSIQQDDSALQLESHLNNEPWHTKVQDPKHLQQKIAVKQQHNNTKSFICMTIKELQYCKSY